MKPWKEFNRTNWPDAYCCINDKGEWVDSGADFHTALLWVGYQTGIPPMNPTTNELIDGMDKSGYSIISLKMCRTMYEAGLIK